MGQEAFFYQQLLVIDLVRRLLSGGQKQPLIFKWVLQLEGKRVLTRPPWQKVAKIIRLEAQSLRSTWILAVCEGQHLCKNQHFWLFFQKSMLPWPSKSELLYSLSCASGEATYAKGQPFVPPFTSHRHPAKAKALRPGLPVPFGDAWGWRLQQKLIWMFRVEPTVRGIKIDIGTGSSWNMSQGQAICNSFQVLCHGSHVSTWISHGSLLSLSADLCTLL
jgi:hypothetical protein